MRSINSIKDNVTLLAGKNIEITRERDALIISAKGEDDNNDFAEADDNAFAKSGGGSDDVITAGQDKVISDNEGVEIVIDKNDKTDFQAFKGNIRKERDEIPIAIRRGRGFVQQNFMRN